MALISLQSSSDDQGYEQTKSFIVSLVTRQKRGEYSITTQYQSGVVTEQVTGNIYQSYTEITNEPRPWNTVLKTTSSGGFIQQVMINDGDEDFQVDGVQLGSITESQFSNIAVGELIISNPQYLPGKSFKVWNGDAQITLQADRNLFVSRSAIPATVNVDTQPGKKFMEVLGRTPVDQVILFTESDKIFSGTDPNASALYAYCGGQVKTITSKDAINRVVVQMFYKIDYSTFYANQL